MAQLVQLIYSSNAKEAFSVGELEGILTASRKNNIDADVTGMLLYRQGSFIQVLEGPEKHVKTIYARIVTDNRHKNVTVLYEGTIQQRDFPSWAMAFNGFEGDALTGLSDFLHLFRSKDEQTLSEGSAKQLLRRFRAINKR